MDTWPETVTQRQMQAHLGSNLHAKTSLVMVSQTDSYRFYKRESDGLWYRLERNGGEDERN